jgi:radical SAM protein with 4Fe4S-binding SPASM domain
LVGYGGSIQTLEDIVTSSTLELLREPRPDEPLSVILKLVGETCNINCYYCYEKRKPYEGKGRLSLDSVQQLLDLADGRALGIELHGGEPLLYGRKPTRDLLRLLRRYRGELSLSIQTNATLLTDEWLDLFGEEWPDVDIGISLDGDDEANRNRVDYRDRSTSERVHQALRRTADRGLRVGLISTVTRQVAERPEATLDFIAGFPAVRAVKFSPCFDFNVVTRALAPGNRTSLLQLNPDGQGHTGWAITPNQFAEFLVRAYDHWRDRGYYQQFLVEPFVSVLRKLVGRTTRFCHFTDQKCAFVLTLYPDGRLGSCDELGMGDAIFGHVSQLDSLTATASLRRNPGLRADLEELLTRCASCAYQSTCGGGCLATRRRYRTSAYYDEYCESRIRIIDHIAADTSTGVEVHA